MAYIGREPQIGNFQVCDAISVVNNQAAYTMQVGGVNVSPETANHMLVSLNGILQAPTTSYTVSGSTITFASNLVTGDVINFIQILGSVLDLGVPSDSTVSLAKLTATGTKNSTTFLRGDNTFAAAGGIVQVKSARQTASESWTAENVMVGPTATITPTSASNKILIMTQGMTSFSSTTVTGTMGLRYATGTSVANTDTLVGGGDAAGSRSRGIAWSGQISANWQGINVSYHILHAPATTSEISYRLCHLGNDSLATGYLGRTGRDTDNNDHPRVDTNITLMEISSGVL
jgi:hypothetical protein